MVSVALEIIPEETLQQLMGNQINYYNDHIEYRMTGVSNWQFNGYKIVDKIRAFIL